MADHATGEDSTLRLGRARLLASFWGDDVTCPMRVLARLAKVFADELQHPLANSTWQPVRPPPHSWVLAALGARYPAVRPCSYRGWACGVVWNDGLRSLLYQSEKEEEVMGAVERGRKGKRGAAVILAYSRPAERAARGRSLINDVHLPR